MSSIPLVVDLIGVTKVSEGKTKQIFSLNDSAGKQALIVSKDDITAGDGAKHDLLAGKSVFSTQTTCNIFRMLKTCGLQVAFDEQVNPVSFKAPLCKMLPYEVIVRREAHGSYLKRTPGLPKGHYFPKLVLEFFLKTSGRKWGPHDLPCDDPLISFLWDVDDELVHELRLYNPANPIASQTPFLVLSAEDVFTRNDESTLIKKMGVIAKRTFLVLEKCWQLLGRTLADFKVEFGTDTEGNLLLADVIDNDSWRVLENGAYIDKQVYRDGGNLDEVTKKYAHVAALTDQFRLPAMQRIIVWVGSDKDSPMPIVEYIAKLTGWSPQATPLIVCSVHKKPIEAIATLNHLVQETPDCVILAFIGRSNGAGPVLSAATTVPVIAIPSTFKEFPHDAWSSLRMPSDVPLMTVLEPANGALAALNILALRNPYLYMLLRERLEERLVNTVQI